MTQPLQPTQNPASPTTSSLKLDLCKDMEMCTETTNVWVSVSFPYVCKGKGQANSQTAEMMLIREYRSKSGINSMLSSHISAHPDRCICIHIDGIHVSVYPCFCTGQSGTVHCACTQGLCFSLSMGLWSISTRMTPRMETPSSLLCCLKNCNQNKSLWR